MLLAVVCLFWLLPRTSSGQSNAPASTHRWLLVVQTTASMQPRAAAIQHIAGSMVFSGMDGQMKQGDTLGVWTYNDKLHAGSFPMQEWAPTNSKTTAQRVYKFLSAQPFEKQGLIEGFFPEIERLIEQSDFITVVLLTDGQEKMSFTPFDEPINATYDAWRKDQEKAGLPFVTVLRGEKGQIASYAVTMPPWPLELPPMPPDAPPPIPAVTKTIPATAPAVVPNLIVSGKKPEPSTNSANPPAAIASDQALPKTESDTWMSAETPKALPGTNVSAAHLQVAAVPAAASKTNSKTLWWLAIIPVLLMAGILLRAALRPRTPSKINLRKPGQG
jgi:hypothetical protein